MLAARAVIGRPALWFLPYLAWVSFAALLNASILALN
jgi:tryptophan-rich sensory protein